MMTTHSPMTAEDFLLLADDDRRHELIRGEPIMMAPASGGHGRIAMRLGSRLDQYVESNSLGIVLAAETGFIIARNPDTVRAPDVAFVSQRQIAGKGIPQEGFVPFAPDLVVEVLSPGDAQLDVEQKIQDWLDAGAKMAWVINPRRRTVAVHRPGSDPRVYNDADTLSGEDVCPGFSIAVSSIFG